MGKGPGLEDGGCSGVNTGERVLTRVPFPLGEGLEIHNLAPLTILGTSNRQLEISKDRDRSQTAWEEKDLGDGVPRA